MPPRLCRDPPVSVPEGSKESPSSVTVRRATSLAKVSVLATSRESQTSVDPKTCSIAALTSSSNPTSSSASCALPPLLVASCWALRTRPASTTCRLILLSGMMVTRRFSPPFCRSSLPVCSVSVTTCGKEEEEGDRFRSSRVNNNHGCVDKGTMPYLKSIRTRTW